jgi:hypothetical protein
MQPEGLVTEPTETRATPVSVRPTDSDQNGSVQFAVTGASLRAGTRRMR